MGVDTPLGTTEIVAIDIGSLSTTFGPPDALKSVGSKGL